MALSDCIHCWSTPCECGWEYRTMSVKELQDRVGMFAMMIAFKTRNPGALFSSWNQKETEDDRRFMEFIGAWKKKE